MLSSSHGVQAEVDKLMIETHHASTEVGNLATSLLMLNNIQFMENRIYEEPGEQTAENLTEAEKVKS